MPAEFSTMDLVAVGLFFGCWASYNLLIDGPLRRAHSINAIMIALREVWMRELLTRENRVVDSTLVGHTISSAAFFASTTVLVLAGLIGVLGSADQAYAAVSKIAMFPDRGQTQFEWKVTLLIAIFIYAFFKFTWALRQYNYFCAVVGSAPDVRTRGLDLDAHSRFMAAVLTRAVRELNAGIRAYYFAFAAFGWFIHSIVLVCATLFMVAVLARRQLFSATARALRLHSERLSCEAQARRT